MESSQPPGAAASSSTPAAPPAASVASADAAERERVRLEFYATYDVMTGVRIAATLGGFFGLMVFLVVYKSRSKSVKALRDPKIVEIAEAAVAEEEAEEEERQLSAALESALMERARMSLGDVAAAAPPGWSRAPRFASVGGGCGALLAPPRRLATLRGDSLPASALRFETRAHADEAECRLLAVPPDLRRLSNVTCSSSGSSYLERRGSSIVCALPLAPPVRNMRAARVPVDIQLIQPTPELSPCPSERALDAGGRAAPLASIGSCGASLSVDYQEYELQSLGPDSVFADEDEGTDDEIEPFSTDSDSGESREGAYAAACVSKPVTRRALRRLSYPTVLRPACATISASVADTALRVEPDSDRASTSRRGEDSTELSFKTGSPLNLDDVSWSQETLF